MCHSFAIIEIFFCLFRILGMPVELQNRLFKYFTDTLNAIVSQAKRTGKYDMGILGELLKVVESGTVPDICVFHLEIF